MEVKRLDVYLPVFCNASPERVKFKLVMHEADQCLMRDAFEEGMNLGDTMIDFASAVMSYFRIIIVKDAFSLCSHIKVAI